MTVVWGLNTCMLSVRLYQCEALFLRFWRYASDNKIAE